MHAASCEVVQHLDIGAAADQHANRLDAMNPGVVPPGFDHGRHRVQTLISDVDPTGFAVIEHRSVYLSGAEQVESLSVDFVSLSPVDGGKVGDDSVAVGDDPMEESARVDRGQLLGIPQQDRLAIAVPNQLGEAGEVFGETIDASSQITTVPGSRVSARRSSWWVSMATVPVQWPPRSSASFCAAVVVGPTPMTG